MNSALDQYADNPIIDELVCWPPRLQKILSVRAGDAIFRKPFIEVRLQDGEVFQRHFPRAGFAADWAEARVILAALTTIELCSDIDCQPPADAHRLAGEALATRADCIADSDRMFAEGLYAQFLMQYGEDCRDLPAETLCKIEIARRETRSAC